MPNAIPDPQKIKKNFTPISTPKFLLFLHQWFYIKNFAFFTPNFEI